MTSSTAKTRRRFFFWLTFLLLESTAGQSLPAAIAQTPWSVFLAAGIRIPQQEVVRKVYGNMQVPAQFGMRFRFAGHWMIDAGLVYFCHNGQARFVDSDSPDENYRTRLTLWSFQLGLGHQWPLKRLRFLVGAGGNWNVYREKWPDAGILQMGHVAGFWAVAGGEYPLISRFFLLAEIRYSSIPTGRGSVLQEKVNLGGGQMLLGVAVHL
jgi:hypothetical protein